MSSSGLLKDFFIITDSSTLDIINKYVQGINACVSDKTNLI